MGGGGRSRTQRKHFRQHRDNVWKRRKFDSQQPPAADNSTSAHDDANGNSNNSNSTWEPFDSRNLSFDEYYKEQGIVPPEEWETFIDYLRTPLPAAFRINSSSQCYMDIRSKLEGDFMNSLQAESADGSEVEAIKPLPWYPENLAWHSNFSRNQLRKNQTLERFHEFLKLQNEIGNITRQEAVSMVPPLFLDVRPDHFVLDSKLLSVDNNYENVYSPIEFVPDKIEALHPEWIPLIDFDYFFTNAVCAAPGSKTFQLLEMIYHSAEQGLLPSGLVIANDVDVPRCNLLIHQTKRMCTANLIVTNHEAQHFPSCHLNRHHPKSSEMGNSEDPQITQLLFDRVLCDVPCSGDGTLRKAPDIWRKWNGGMANGLYGLQVQIAMRGLSLLKVGGRMVYSTCSMNPVENEAVVAEVLRRCGQSVELLDVSNELPHLIRRPGLKRWKVKDKGVWLTSYRDVPKHRRAAIVPGMFPSGKTEVDSSMNEVTSTELCDNGCNQNFKNVVLIAEHATSTNIMEEEVSTLPLEHCMRIVPHDQNTGAFFIAVFQKLSQLPDNHKELASQPEKLNSSEYVQIEKSTAEIKEASKGLEAKSADTESVRIHEGTKDTDILDNDIDDPTLNNKSGKTSQGNEADDVQPSTNTSASPEAEMVGRKRKLQIQGKWRGVDPVIFFREDEVINKIKNFYGIKESLPFDGHLITRNSDINHVKRIYYISKSVKKVLELNFITGQQLKIASVGLKISERHTSKDSVSAPCAFRITSEGLPLLLPHVTKQILYASPIDFKHLLQYKSIKFADFVDADFGEKASNLLLGCCVVVLDKDKQVAIGCWKGRANISVMVSALDCQELLERMPMYMEEDTALSLHENKPSFVKEEDQIGDNTETKANSEVLEQTGT